MYVRLACMYVWVACMCLNTTLPPIAIITAIIFSSLKGILSMIPLSDAKSSLKRCYKECDHSTLEAEEPEVGTKRGPQRKLI